MVRRCAARARWGAVANWHGWSPPYTMRRLLQHAKGGLDVKITGASTSTAVHYYCKLFSTKVVLMGGFRTLNMYRIFPTMEIIDRSKLDSIWTQLLSTLSVCPMINDRLICVQGYLRILNIAEATDVLGFNCRVTNQFLRNVYILCRKRNFPRVW